MNMEAVVSQPGDWEGVCPGRLPKDTESEKLGGVIPSLVLEPKTGDQVARILAKAAVTGNRVAIAGGLSRFSAGAPLLSVNWLIRTLGLRQEPEIRADDMVVFVQAGVLLSDLQERLFSCGLFLPTGSDLPGATIGGTIAYGESPLIRDSVLGMKVALLDGKIYRFGGQTVKNVAGYDVAKLFIGSKGTLGVITELCLRVYPLSKENSKDQGQFAPEKPISLTGAYSPKPLSSWDEKIKQFFDARNLLNPGKRP